jgi:hypothetical protein
MSSSQGPCPLSISLPDKCFRNVVNVRQPLDHHVAAIHVKRASDKILPSSEASSTYVGTTSSTLPNRPIGSSSRFRAS